MARIHSHFGCGIPNHPQNHAHQHFGGWRDCASCQGLLSHALIAACASVGIERGKSIGVTLDEYMDGRHSRQCGPINTSGDA